MTLDKEIYAILTKHIMQSTTEVTEILAVLSGHLAMVIQCLDEPPAVKVAVAEQVLECVIDEIKKDPSPMKRRLN